jgi:hypothetical protein
MDTDSIEWSRRGNKERVLVGLNERNMAPDAGDASLVAADHEAGARIHDRGLNLNRAMYRKVWK